MDLRTNPEIAADIDTLTAELAALSVGATARYADLSAAIGRDVQGAGRYALNKARRRAEEETGAIFEAVHKTGIRRLPAADTASVGQAAVQKIRRAAKRGAARLGRVRANDMSEQDAREITAYRSHLGAIAMVADCRKTKTLIGTVPSGDTLPAGRVLDMFKR